MTAGGIGKACTLTYPLLSITERRLLLLSVHSSRFEIRTNASRLSCKEWRSRREKYTQASIYPSSSSVKFFLGLHLPHGDGSDKGLSKPSGVRSTLQTEPRSERQ